MKNIFIIKIFRSHYCKIILVFMLFIGYRTMPENFFFGWYNVLAWLFIFLFSLTITCLVRSIKEKIILQKKNRKSIISISAGLIGLSAFQVCGVGAPICGASVGAAVVSSLFPGFAFNILNDYMLYFIYASIALQIYSLFQMKCFARIINNQDCS